MPNIWDRKIQGLALPHGKSMLTEFKAVWFCQAQASAQDQADVALSSAAVPRVGL